MLIMMIDHRSPVPLRAQVEQLLRDLVQKPEYKKDGKLIPNEDALAAQLGVSRGTIRSGISKLVFEGLLERKAGVGTRVKAPAAETGIHAWRSFTREMAAKGIIVKNFRLDYRQIAAPQPVALALQIDAGTLVWCLDRIRGWNDKPVLSSTSWFHPRLGLKGTEDFTQPLYETIEAATGIKPHTAQEKFLAVEASLRLAKVLQVSRKEPLLLRRHSVCDSGRRLFEFSEVYYVSSRFTVTLDLRRGEP